MSVMETATLDMAEILLRSYELGDWINQSVEVAEYLYWKNRLAEDEEAQRLLREFAKAKEKFAECQRFGRYHPDYHETLAEVKQMQSALDACESVKRFKEAEERLDELLYAVSKTIADAVSPTIKVLSNRLEPIGGCGAGGCSGGCGSCG